MLAAPVRLPTSMLLAVALLVACGKPSPPAAPGATAPALATTAARMVPVPTERQLDGTVEAVRQVTLAAQTSGRVAEILHDVNDLVAAGAVLVRLRGTEQRAGLEQAEAARREAAAREAEAQARFRRIQDMYQRQVVARAQFDQAEAERDAAVARLAAATAAATAAREGLDYTVVRAPYASIITGRLVEVGQSVVPGTPLVSAAALENLRVTVEIPQSLAEQARRSGQALVHAGGQPIAARALVVFPAAEAGTGSFRARIQLPPGTSGLLPGMYVKVGLVTGVAARLLVPATAIIRRSEVTAVYVVADNGQVSLRQIRTGSTYGDQVEVLAGVQPGELVALDPLAALRLLTRGSAAGHG